MAQSCNNANKRCIFPKNAEGLSHGICSCYWDIDKKDLSFTKQFHHGQWINEYVLYHFNGDLVHQYVFLDTNSTSVFTRTFEYIEDSIAYRGKEDKFVQLIPQVKESERILKAYVANPPYSSHQIFVITNDRIIDTFSKTSIPYISYWKINDSLVDNDSILFEIHSIDENLKTTHVERYKSSMLESYIPGAPFEDDHVTPNVSSGRKIR